MNLERTISMYLMGAAATLASVAGCKDDCSDMNANAQGNYFVSVSYDADDEEYKCPKGCTKIGETEEKYCCDCPE